MHADTKTKWKIKKEQLKIEMKSMRDENMTIATCKFVSDVLL